MTIEINSFAQIEVKKGVRTLYEALGQGSCGIVRKKLEIGVLRNRNKFDYLILREQAEKRWHEPSKKKHYMPNEIAVLRHLTQKNNPHCPHLLKNDESGYSMTVAPGVFFSKLEFAFNEHTFFAVMYQATQAVRSLYSDGVVNIDIPFNMIEQTSSNGKPVMARVIDFGFAYFVKNGQVEITKKIAREIIVPPEVADTLTDTHRYIDAQKTAVFTLGSMWYRLLEILPTDHRAERDIDFETYDIIQRDDLALGSRLKFSESDEIAWFVSCMTDRDPRNRPNLAEVEYFINLHLDSSQIGSCVSESVMREQAKKNKVDTLVISREDMEELVTQLS